MKLIIMYYEIYGLIINFFDFSTNITYILKIIYIILYLCTGHLWYDIIIIMSIISIIISIESMTKYYILLFISRHLWSLFNISYVL